MSKRPEFTIAQITEQFDVSRSTVRRGLTNGRFPNAIKNHHGRWTIPVDDVLQAGFTPRKTWLNDPAHEPGSQGGHDHGQHGQTTADANEQAGFMNQVHLENELAHERAQVDKLKALLEAERAHVESLRMALRMIEPGISSPPTTAQDVASTRTVSEPSSEQTMSEQPPTSPRPRFFQRLFNLRDRQGK